MIDISFDGGSKNNQSKSLRRGYGSFRTFHNGEKVTMNIVKESGEKIITDHYSQEYGSFSNNESELATAVLALQYACQIQQRSKSKLQFTFQGDSQLVIGFLTGESRIKAKNLQPLANLAIEAVNQISATFVKEDGEKIKEVLGH